MRGRELGRRVSMQGVLGQDGKGIAARMLADTRFTDYFKVIWDRHRTNQSPRQYLAELKPMIDRAAETGDFIILSDIRQLIADEKIDPAADRRTTETINRGLARLYPANFLDVTGLLEDPATRQADGLHLTPSGNTAVARALAAALAERGL